MSTVELFADANVSGSLAFLDVEFDFEALVSWRNAPCIITGHEEDIDPACSLTSLCILRNFQGDSQRDSSLPVLSENRVGLKTEVRIEVQSWFR